MSPVVRQRVLILVILTVFLDMIGFGMVMPLLPLYIDSMKASRFMIGVILSFFSLAQLVATPILGRLSDKHGRRKVILFSLVGNALAMIVFAIATDLRLLPLFFLSRVIAGATSGNLSACQAAIADVTRKEERAAAMGRLGAGISLGMIMGPVMGGWLGALAPWAPPVGAAGMALLDVVLTYFLMPETRWKGASSAEDLASAEAAARASAPGPAAGASVSAPEVKGPPPSILEVLRERRMAAVLVLYFLTFICITNLQVALALLAKDRMQWGPREVGFAFGLFGMVGLIIQGALIGRLAKAAGELNLVIAGALINVVGMVCIGFAHQGAVLIAGLAIFGVGISITNPLLSTIASRLARDEQQGAVLGFAQSSGTLGRTIGPTWSALLLDGFGATAPFISGAVAAVFAFVVGLVAKSGGAAKPSSNGDAGAGRVGDQAGRAGDQAGRAGDQAGRAGDQAGRAGDQAGRAGGQ